MLPHASSATVGQQIPSGKGYCFRIFAGSRVLLGFDGLQNPVKILKLEWALASAFPHVTVVDWKPRSGLSKGNPQRGVCAQIALFFFFLLGGGFCWFCRALPGFKALPNLEVEKGASECFPTRRLQPLVNRSPLARVIVLESLLDPGFCWVSTGCTTLSKS